MTAAVIIAALLAVAAWRDITTRTIPDSVSVAIVLVGLAARIPAGWSAVQISLGVAVILFLILLPLSAIGLLGGGDVKLLAALACGLSPLQSYQLIAAVVAAGGLLALVYLAMRWLATHTATLAATLAATPARRSLAGRLVTVELWRLRRGAPVPYALAIAAGASLVIGHQGA